VQAGRVAYVNFGEDYGKLVVIVDWTDDRSVLIDGPHMPRVLYPLRRLTLTKFVLNIERGARGGVIAKAWKAEGLQAKWDASTTATKKTARDRRAQLNDYERFAVMINRKQRSYAVRALAAKALAGQKGPVKKAAEKAKGKK